MTKILAPLLLMFLLALAAVPAARAERLPGSPVVVGETSTSRGQLESMLRESTDYALQEEGEDSEETAPVFGGDIGARVVNSFWSLIIPGWAQFRSGYNTRGAVFLGAEVAIWGSYAIFKAQENSRSNSAADYARQFASASGGDESDQYWRAVGDFLNNDSYNEDLLRDARIGLEPENPFYAGDQSWRWQSEARFTDYNGLRADVNSSEENANTVLMFALVNRLISFIDAMRIDPQAGKAQPLIEARGMALDFGLQPSVNGPAPTLSLSTEF